MPRPSATVEPLDDYFAQSARRAAQTFAEGDLVVLVEGVGTKAERAIPHRVVELKPVAGRVDYVIQAVTGGRRTVAQSVHLDPAPPHMVALAARTPVPTFTPVVGNVVTVAPRTLRGEPDGQRYVILAVGTGGMAKIVRLGGDEGRYFPKCPIAAMRLVPLADL